MDVSFKPKGNKVRIMAMDGKEMFDYLDLPLCSITSPASIKKIDSFCENHNLPLFKYHHKASLFADHIEKNVASELLESENILDELEDTTYNKIGIGVHDNRLYYGFKSVPKSRDKDPFDYIVDHEGNLYIENQIQSGFGLTHRFPFFNEVLDKQMNVSSVKKFLSAMGKVTQSNTPTETQQANKTRLMDLKVNSSGIYKAVFDLIKKYIYFRIPENYHVLTAYIFLTYVYVLFPAVPRLFLHAEYASGKTKTTNLIGSLCFNPMTSGDASISSLFRSIESTGATVLIDDFDKVNSEVRQELDRLIRIGYKRGGSVKRTNTTDFEPEGFDVYSCLVINNIEGLDEVALSRCIEIALERSVGEPQLNEVLHDNDPELAELKDNLQLTSLVNAKDLMVFLETFKPTENELLQGRPQEMVAPLEAMMKFYEVEDCGKVVGYLAKLLKEQTSDISINDTEAVMLKWMWVKVSESATSETPVVSFNVRDLSYHLVELNYHVDNYTDPITIKKLLRSTNSMVGKYLAKFSFQKKRTGKGVIYSVDVNHLKSCIISRDLAELCDIGVSDKTETNDTDKPKQIEQIDATDGSAYLEPKLYDVCESCKDKTGSAFLYNDKHTGKPTGKTMFLCDDCLDFMKKQGLTGVRLSSLRGGR